MKIKRVGVWNPRFTRFLNKISVLKDFKPEGEVNVRSKYHHASVASQCKMRKEERTNKWVQHISNS